MHNYLGSGILLKGRQAKQKQNTTAQPVTVMTPETSPPQETPVQETERKTEVLIAPLTEEQVEFDCLHSLVQHKYL